MTQPNTQGTTLHITTTSLSHLSRRRRRSYSLSWRNTGPSSGLLSLFATVAASSCAVDGSPLTYQRSLPDFLYLYVGYEKVDSPSEFGAPSLYLSPRANKRRSRYERRDVPIRYEQGPDGLWRQVDAYTLYGSTICRDDCTATSTATLDQDDIADPTSSATSPTDLPPGWNPPKPHSPRSTFILTASLMLTFFICILMIGCIFWRKRKRLTFFKNRDIESRVRKRRRHLNEDGDGEESKEVRMEQKIWARATARWKANARYSARQRRGKRSGRNSQAQSSSVSLHTPPGESDVPGFSCFSQSHPPRQSSSIRGVSSEPAAPHHHSPDIDRTTPSIRRSLSHSPPAYPQQYTKSSPASPTDSIHAGQTLLPPPISRRSSYHHDNDDLLSSCPQQLVAHVATDDKTLLARLASLANEPPPAGDDDTPESSTAQISAPVWRDEELDDFADISKFSPRYPEHDGTIPPDLQSTATSMSCCLPPPPSAVYEYSFSLEAIDPEPGPSAPPFEETAHSQLTDLLPSAPPLAEFRDYDGITPTAPPWHDDDEIHTYS